MQALYFGYCVAHGNGNDRIRHRVDLRKFVHDFVASTDNVFKAKFSHNGETLLLLPLVAPTYMLVQARDNEIIKKIERTSWNAEDIHAQLARDESIGFASYLSLHDSYFAIASRILSPRKGGFVSLVNQIFQARNIGWQFEAIALQSSLPKDEIVTLNKVGSIVVEVSQKSGLFATVRDYFLGKDGTELEDVSSMQVTMRSIRKKGADLGEAAVKIAAQTGDALSLEIRAKADAADVMSDFYIIGQGGVKDFIAVESEKDVPAAMTARASANKELTAQLKEFNNDPKFTNADAATLGITW